jgi:flagellar motor switch/type III secretory pathway protein FliN
MADADSGAQPVADFLPVLDAGQADFANAVHALIAGAPSLELVRGCHAVPAGALALADPAGLFWQVPATADAGDLDGQVALLTAGEPLLQALEQALGVAFRPAETVTEWPVDTLWIGVRHDGGEALFGFAPAMQSAARLAPAHRSVIHDTTPRSVRLAFRAASLPLTALEGVGAGDLLCLPAGPLVVNLAGAPPPPIGSQWRWDPADGTLQSAGHIENAEGPAMDSSENAGLAPMLSVPVTVRLPAVAVPAAELATLAEGGTVRLMPLAEGLEVELLVAGRPIATGELVRLGDDFAVLVEQIAGRPAASQPAGDV